MVFLVVCLIHPVPACLVQDYYCGLSADKLESIDSNLDKVGLLAGDGCG